MALCQRPWVRFMIIDDKHEIAFIHIPKCAGTTVRKHLQPFDRSNGYFTARVEKHNQLGMLDYVHIPLFVLKEYFLEEFDLVNEYWSFAIMRDPFSRFASSVSQRLKMYGGMPIHEMSKGEIINEVNVCIDFLRSKSGNYVLLPAEYIHFQRQIDYIYVDKKKVVKSIYTMSDISLVLNLLQEKIGGEAEDIADGESLASENNTLVYRNDLIRLIIKMIKPCSSLLPNGIRDVFRDKVYVSRDSKMADVFMSDTVRGFVEDYYRSDIELFNKVNKKR